MAYIPPKEWERLIKRVFAVDADGHLQVDVLSQAPPAVLAGEKIVATAGTPVPLGSGALRVGVLIQAKPGNTGVIYVGNPTTQKVELSAGKDIFVRVDDLADIYIDASVSGEGVNYIGS